MHETMVKSIPTKHDHHGFRMYETMQIRHTVVKKQDLASLQNFMKKHTKLNTLIQKRQPDT